MRETVGCLTNISSALQDSWKVFRARCPESMPRSLAAASICYVHTLFSDSGQSTQSLAPIPTLMHILHAGVHINDFYDLVTLGEGNWSYTRGEYIRHRRWLNERLRQREKEAWRTYYAKVTSLEKTRPNHQGNREKITAYREQVNLWSLALCFAIAFEKELNYFVTEQGKFSKECPKWFKAFFYFTMSGQVIDDLIGWHGDLKSQRPSFYTASFFANDQNHRQARRELKSLAKSYWRQASDMTSLYLMPIKFSLLGINQLGPVVYTLFRQVGFQAMMSDRDWKGV